MPIQALKSLSRAALLTALIFTPTISQAEIDATVPGGGRGSPPVPSNITDYDGNVIDIASVDENTAFIIGNTRYGKIIINDGSVLNSRSAYMGFNPNIAGYVKVTDPGSQWNVNGYLYVGDAGTGTVDINNGATIEVERIYLGHQQGSSGTLNLSDPGSKITFGRSASFSVGTEGDGVLNIENGAQLNISTLSLGSHENSSGALTIKGQGTVVDASIYAGGNGPANVHIGDQAVFNSSFAIIGLNSTSTSTVSVTGLGTQWNIESVLEVGQSGTATLNISDQAVVTAPTIKINNNSYVDLTNATLNVDYIDSDLITESRIIGTGILNIKSTVFDQTITFSEPADLTRSWTANNSSLQNITVNLDMSQSPKDFGAGKNGNGIVNIENGMHITSKHGLIGDSTGASGIVNITGGGSKWSVHDPDNDNATKTIIGNYGYGELNVTNGASFSGETVAAGSQNSGSMNINISGANTTFNSEELSTHNGTVNITDRAVVTTKHYSFNSKEDTETIVNVSGQDTKLISQYDDGYYGQLYLGYRGKATMNVTDGAYVQTAYISMAQEDRHAEATINLDGQNTLWKNEVYVTLGDENKATINISNGATFQTDTIYMMHQDSEINLDNGHMIFNYFDMKYLAQVKGTGSIDTKSTHIDHTIAFSNQNNLTSAWRVQDSDRDIAFTLDASEPGETFAVGFNGHGSVDITNGVKLEYKYARLGENAGSSGNIKIQGPGSELLVTGTRYDHGEMFIGINGDAQVDIIDGAVLDTNDTRIAVGETSTATVNVRGQNSIWRFTSTYNDDTLSVGGAGHGTLNVTEGAKVFANSMTVSGTGTGIVNVNGPGSHIRVISEIHNEGNLNVGYKGTGSLNITNGGRADARYAVISSRENGTSSISIDGPNSVLNSQEGLALSGPGATLHITNGGVANSGSGLIGSNYYGGSHVFLDGEGSEWNIATDLGLGQNIVHDSSLNISNGAQLNIENDFSMNGGVTISLSLSSTDDQFITINGKTVIDGYLRILTDDLEHLNLNDEFVLFHISGTEGGERSAAQQSATEPVIDGEFINILESEVIGTINGLDLVFTYHGGDGNDISVYAIPEPTTLFTLLTLAPLTLLRSRRSAVNKNN